MYKTSKTDHSDIVLPQAFHTAKVFTPATASVGGQWNADSVKSQGGHRLRRDGYDKSFLYGWWRWQTTWLAFLPFLVRFRAGLSFLIVQCHLQKRLTLVKRSQPEMTKRVGRQPFLGSRFCKSGFPSILSTQKRRWFFHRLGTFLLRFWGQTGR